MFLTEFRMQKYTRGIILRVGIFLTVTPVKFDRALNTGQIGWKFAEITLYACLVELGIISMDLHPI